MSHLPGGNIKCPRCFSERSRVRDSRGCVDMNAIRRRRHCIGCGNRYTTYESAVVPQEYELAQKITAALNSVADLQVFLANLLNHITPGEYDGHIKPAGESSGARTEEEKQEPHGFSQLSQSPRLSVERFNELLQR